MSKERKNAIANLVDLRSRIEPDENDKLKYTLRAEVRAGKAELYDEERRLDFTAAATKITVRLRMEGADIAPGPRFGEPIRATGPTTKVSDKSETNDLAKIALSAGAGLSGSGPPDAKLAGSLEASKEAKRTRVVETQHETTVQYVIARGGETWEVADPTKKFLDGTYIQDSDELCKLLKNKGANRSSYSATVEIKQRDLVIEHDKNAITSIVNNTKRRLIDIVLAKAMKIDDGPKNAHVISRTEEEIDD